MNAVWTISGEPGKALDAQTRSLAEVGMLDPILRLESLDVDTLTWTQREGIIAERTQEISLFRNGARVFAGTVTSRPYRYAAGGGSGYKFTASGALYKMSIAQIQSARNDVTQTGVLRPTYQFQTGDLRDMVLRLLASSPGVVAGAVDLMFPVAQRTFTSGTFLGMLVDLLKPVMDAASWVNYAVAGTPQLHIVRRRNMASLVIQIGKDDVAEIDLDARAELQLRGVRLAYAERNAAGQPVFRNQAAGDGSQLVIVSGPEAGDFIPPDNNSQTDVNTMIINGAPAVTYKLVTTIDMASQFRVRDTNLKALVATYGSALPGTSDYAGTVVWEEVTVNGFKQRRERNLNLQPLYIQRSDGVYVNVNNPIVTSARVPEWFKGQAGGNQIVDVTITAPWVAIFDRMAGQTTTFPPGFNALWNKTPVTARGHGYASNATNNFDIRYWCAMPCSMSVEVSTYRNGTTLTQAGTGGSGTTTTTTTSTKNLGYGFVAPPAGMAAGMLEAASFIPYDGTISLNPGFPWGRFLATRCNVFGGDPELQAAGAIIQSAEVVLQTGEVSLRAGAPARVTLESQLSNLNVNSKDNLYLL